VGRQLCVVQFILSLSSLVVLSFFSFLSFPFISSRLRRHRRRRGALAPAALLPLRPALLRRRSGTSAPSPLAAAALTLCSGELGFSFFWLN